MRTEPADTGGSSSTQLTQIEQDYMADAAANAMALGVGSIAGAAGIAAGTANIEFNEEGIDQMIQYFEKIKTEELQDAQTQARLVQSVTDPGHPEGSLYTMSVQELGENYMQYHRKMSDAVDKTIDALKRAKEQYRANEESHAKAFSDAAGDM